MPLSSEKLINYIITELQTVQNQIDENLRNQLSDTSDDELSYLTTATDELRGYKFALEDILDALPDFEQK